MSQKICSLFLAVVMLFTFSSASVFASDVMLFADYGSAATSYLSLNGTTATCKSTFPTEPTVKSITITQTLEKSTLWWWDEINTWERTFNQSSATYTNSRSSLSSGTYRVKSVFTVTATNGASETITVYSAEKKVS